MHSFLSGLFLRVATFLLVLGVLPTSAVLLRVPDDFESILLAADAAVPGDTVVVGSGVWTHVDTRVVSVSGIPRTVTACAFLKGGVTVLGAGVDQTIVDPSQEDAGAGWLVGIGLLDPAVSEGVVLGDLTVRGVNRDPGRAVSATGALSLTLVRCRLTDNSDFFSPALGAAETDVSLIECRVDNNVGGAGAISVSDGSLLMERCLIEDNDGRAVLYATDEPGRTLRVEDCEFRRNRAEVGPCLAVSTSDDFRIADCLFEENVASGGEGGGAIWSSVSTGTIEFCVFVRDSCTSPTGLGGALFFDRPSTVVRNNVFLDCYAPQFGAAVAVFGGLLEFERNAVVASRGGAALIALGDPAFGGGTGCNLMWLNEGGNYAVEWIQPSTDVFEDPQFCDVATGDLSVSAGSPCVAGNCAPMGAFGVGCEPVSVESQTWSRTKALYR